MEKMTKKNALFNEDREPRQLIIVAINYIYRTVYVSAYYIAKY